MWPWGFREVKAPGFLDNRYIKVVSLSALRTDRLYPQEYPGTHFETWVDPGHMDLSDASEKIPSGIVTYIHMYR
jgi:hypothetical protein